MSRPDADRRVQGLALGVVAALLIGWVFRYQIANGFTLLLGDAYDGLIEASIYEHWHRVLTGHENWKRTSYFFPVKDTLGYNDGFLLNGAIFTILRFLRLDPLLAREITAVIIRLVGFLSFHALARRGFGFAFMPSLAGAALFTVANSLWIHGVHAQLITLDFAPLLFLLAWLSIRGVPRRSARTITGYGMLAACLYGAWLMTGFYMVWFFTLFCIATALCSLLVVPYRSIDWRSLGSAAWAMRIPIAIVTAGLALCLLPFLDVYIPKVRETGQHGWAEVLVFLPPPLAILHVGHGNLLYGSLDASLVGRLLDIGENTVGLTPGVLLAGAAGAVWRPRFGHRTLLGAIGLGCLLTAVITLQVDGWSAWHWVFNHVPGARGIRAVSRVMLFLGLPMAMLCTAALDRLWSHRPPLAVLLGMFLLLEQVNLAPQLGLDRPMIDAVRAQLGTPPSSCRSFFTTEAAPPPSVTDVRLFGLYHANTPAMFFSEWLGIPTINGFSTFNPPDWELDIPWSPTYPGRVALYAFRHGVQDGLCALDYTTLAWNTAPFAALIPPPGDVTIDAVAPAVQVHFGHGWSLPEPFGLWTDGRRAEVATFLRPDTRYRSVDITALPFKAGDAISPVRFFIDDRLLLDWTPSRDMATVTVPVPADLQRLGYLRFRFDIARPRSPQSLGGSADARSLGLFLRSIVVHAAPG